MLAEWSLRIWGAMAVAISLTAAIPHANAQDAQARSRARQIFAEGQRLFREGQFAEAEAAFLQAHELVPNPVVLKGVADARERSGNLTGAVEMIERYLGEREDVPAAERAELEARVAHMRSQPGTVAVASTPEGATILLDGSDTGLVTPAELPELAAGEHAIVLSLPGHETAQEMVNVPFGGRTEVQVELVAEAPDEPAEAVVPDGEPIEMEEEEVSDDEEEADNGPGAAVWVTSALAAAALVTGTVLGFVALSREAEFDEMPTEDSADKGQQFALFADVAFGVAAVSAITAIVLFLTRNADDTDDDDTEPAAAARLQVAPAVGPRGGGVAARLQF